MLKKTFETGYFLKLACDAIYRAGQTIAEIKNRFCDAGIDHLIKCIYVKTMVRYLNFELRCRSGQIKSK